MKKTLACLGFLCVALFSLCAFSACSSSDNPYEDLDRDDAYAITDLDVSIDASAGDRSMRIVEKYTFEFTAFSHGFYRDIPTNSGEKVRDLRVKDASDFHSAYKLSFEDDILRVRVGSADSFVDLSRPLCCTVEYTLVTPRHKTYEDALVLNVIGQGWTCRIDNAHIHVKLPAATDEMPRYYYGKWGDSLDPVTGDVMDATYLPQSGQSDYDFRVHGLDAFEGFTVYYFLPAGALGAYTDWTVFAVIVCALVVAAAVFLLRFMIGRSPVLTPITSYYPPKSVKASEKDLPLDPVEMGYLIDNTCQGSDVTSLIFYFASRGYLQLVPPEEGDKKDDFTLKKVCDPPADAPDHQVVFFKKLFANGDTATVKSLTNRTYTAVQNVQSQVKRKYAGKLYEKKGKVCMFSAYVAVFLLAFLTVGLTNLRVHPSLFSPVGCVVLIPVILSALFGLYIVSNRPKLKRNKRIALTVLMAIVTSIASALLLIAPERSVLGWAESLVLTVAVALSCTMAPFISSRRTRYYTDELNPILGFKDFLQTAEKDRLETLLEENPQYYYDILPYANVLGVSDIWQNKFEGLTVAPPSYYNDDAVFDFLLFNSLYRSSFRAYSVAAISRPSSSSSSGGGRHFGGGGGFSGGGFGGGGGGRW